MGPGVRVKEGASMLHALALAVAATCSGDRGAAAWLPPVLPAAFSDRYPDGLHFDVTLTYDGAAITDVVTKPATGPGAASAAAWGRSVRLGKLQAGCPPMGRTTMSMRFFPASSGVLALPPVTAGVNFNELRYTPGPCYEDESAPMHGGYYSYFSKQASTGLSASVENVFAGMIGGRRVALVWLRCEFPVGFNDEARLYEMTPAGPRAIATLAKFALPAPDDPYVDGGWLRVNFEGGRLNIDAWDYFKNCDAKHDWVQTVFTLRGGQLVQLWKHAHHRAGVEAACSR